MKNSMMGQLGQKIKIFRKVKLLSHFITSGEIALAEEKQTESIFSRIYQTNGFRGKESVSGPGSDLSQTRIIRKKIQVLLEELNTKILLDAPCGDFYWMKEVELNRLDKYIGVDIVLEIIAQNQQIYGNNKTSFQKLDIVKNKLPKADLILCRDALVHLDFESIFAAIKNFKKSRSRYLLTTTFTDRSENTDIPIGYWRPINLQLPPFNFPTPIKILNEGCTEDGGIYSDKSLGLWEIKKIYI